VVYLVGVVAVSEAGVDSAWEQDAKRLEARKMLAVGATESPASSACFVRRFCCARLTG
jgi:hypothetical protein